MRHLIDKVLGRKETPAPATEAADTKPLAADIPFSPLPVKRHAREMPVLPVAETAQPKVSVVLVVYRMRRQAMNTIHTLTTPYQRGVSDRDFELIVVENASDENLVESEVLAAGSNVSYHLRQETRPTPVFAANFGASQARGELVTVMLDGARMVTPGLINYLIAAQRLSTQAVIATPSYHLGHRVQQKAMLEGYDEAEEQQLLASVDWRQDGYRLFEISCLSRTSMGGIFRPFGESNCLSLPLALYREIGGFDEAFDETGGGQANLDLYKRAVEHPGSDLIVLPGEGSFHQFHGGVTTGQQGEERHQAMVAHFAQYAALRGGPYIPPDKRPIYFGPVPDSAVRFIRNSGNMLINTLRDEGEA